MFSKIVVYRNKLCVYYTHDYKSLRISTPFHCLPSDWNKIKQIFRASCSIESQTEILNEVKRLRDDIDTVILNDIQLHGDISIDRIKTVLKKPKVKEVKKDTVLRLLEDFIQYKTDSNSCGSGRVRIIEQLQRQLKDFIGESDIMPNEVDDGFMMKFEHYLSSRLASSTLKRRIKEMKCFYVYLNKMHSYPINKSVSEFQVKAFESETVVLTKSQLVDLQNYKPKLLVEKKVQSIFLFLCYSGMAYSDYLDLDLDRHIVDGCIVKYRVKTKVKFVLPIHPILQEIIRKYNRDLPKLCQQRFNKKLKEMLSKMLSFKHKVKLQKDFNKLESGPFYSFCGSHTGRRTFCDICLRASIPIQTIMGYTAHSSSKMLLGYASKYGIGIEKSYNNML